MKQACRALATTERKHRKKKRLRILLGAALLVVSALLFAASAVFEMDAWTRLDVSRITNVPQTLILYDRDDREISTLHASEDRIWIALSDIPKHTRDAFISAEDARFYEHFGIDVIRILGAAWADLKAGAYVQGASTISQQLIKLSHLTAEKKMTRKLEEAILAYQLEQLYSKDEILEMYLNYVYFGGGYYGIEAAARGYFGVPAGRLSAAQSAQLAGVLKSPSRFAPHLHPEASAGRRNVVLDLMAEYGYLSSEECAVAKAEEPVITHTAGQEPRGSYVELAMSEAREILNVDMDTLLSGGYRIYTAMDRTLQSACESAFADPESFPAVAGDVQPEAAVVVMDVKTGGVAALLGGRESSVAFGYNRAVRIRRQPGSVIKPVLVYAPALEAGYTAATMLLDEQMDFSGYQPGNSSDTFEGWVTMREAVTHSLNIPAVAVMNQLGVPASKAFAAQFGVEFDARDRSLALALGGFTYGVSPMQMAGAYAAFANGGVYNAPSVIRLITDCDGNVLYQHTPEQTRVMRAANAYVLTSMLKSVVTDGTGRRLGELNIPLAGKTGTTGDAYGNRDAWMAAYNPAYAAAVWIGMDDAGEGRALPENATGGTYPALILKRVFSSLYPDGNAPDFVMPAGVREYRIDSHTLDAEHVAVLASALTPDEASYSEVFVEGTEPAEMSDYWDIPSPPGRLSASAGDGAALVFFETPSRYILYRLYRENSQGKSVLMGEFSGENGSVSFEDTTLTQKGVYQYYVVPVHPQLTVQGERVTGSASYRVSVQVR